MKVSDALGIAALAACLTLPLAAQQPASSSSQSSSPPSSSDQAAPAPDNQQASPDQTVPTEKKKESRLKRKLKEAAPSCIGIEGGAAKCRQSKDEDDANEEKKEAQEQALRDRCRDAADQPGTPAPECVELRKSEAAHDLQVGDDYFSDKHYPSAENRYRLALQEDPANATAMLHLAEVLEKTGHNSEAADEYQKFLAADPDGRDAQKARKALARLAPYRQAPVAR